MNDSHAPDSISERKQYRIAIAGASSGIGAAIAEALLQDGHKVWMCARRSDRLDALANRRPNASVHRCDVGDENDVIEFAARVADETPALDVLINCAGTYGPIGPAVEVNTVDWERALRTNVLGALYLARHFTPLLREGVDPTIISFAGGGAFDPLPNFSAYAVSKSALVRLVETLAVELAEHGITCNAVAPGFVVTEIHEATLAAGPELAGKAFHDQTAQALETGVGAIPIDWPVACVRHLLVHRNNGLTGKTISVSFDPWASPEFEQRVPEINASSLYAMERINLRHLEDSELKRSLESAPRGPRA